MLHSCYKSLVAVGLIFCLVLPVYSYSGGAGTQISPYRISTAFDWQTLMNTSGDWNKYFILAADINLYNVSLTPVGDPGDNFIGNFNGSGHIICNAKVNWPFTYYMGLFGYIGTGARIYNLEIEDVNVAGYRYVGGLVGYNYKGLITACHITGAVRGSQYVGGLVGYNNDGNFVDCNAINTVIGVGGYAGGLVGHNYLGDISGCYAGGTVEGNQYIGGLAGYSSGNLTCCYALGSVVGYFDYIGGLAGSNNGIITNCYSAGAVSGTSATVGGLVGYSGGAGAAIYNSFWDIQTSGQTSNTGGQGKMTADMKTLSTFTSASWDFVGETVNGTEDIWRMCVDNVCYPEFSWQFLPGDFACPDGVDFMDFAALAKWWMSANSYCDIAPLTGDGIINFSDLAVFCDNWLE